MSEYRFFKKLALASAIGASLSGSAQAQNLDRFGIYRNPDEGVCVAMFNTTHCIYFAGHGPPSLIHSDNGEPKMIMTDVYWDQDSTRPTHITIEVVPSSQENKPVGNYLDKYDDLDYIAGKLDIRDFQEGGDHKFYTMSSSPLVREIKELETESQPKIITPEYKISNLFR